MQTFCKLSARRRLLICRYPKYGRQACLPTLLDRPAASTIYVQDKQGIKISKIDFFATTPYILEVKKIRHILDT